MWSLNIDCFVRDWGVPSILNLFKVFLIVIKSLALKLETTHKPAKLPINQSQTSQTIHKSPKI